MIVTPSISNSDTVSPSVFLCFTAQETLTRSSTFNSSRLLCVCVRAAAAAGAAAAEILHLSDHMQGVDATPTPLSWLISWNSFYSLNPAQHPLPQAANYWLYLTMCPPSGTDRNKCPNTYHVWIRKKSNNFNVRHRSRLNKTYFTLKLVSVFGHFEMYIFGEQNEPFDDFTLGSRKIVLIFFHYFLTFNRLNK